MKYTIIIADDHAMFIDGVKSILNDEANIDVRLTAASGEQVLKYLQINTEETIDLVITDLNMPGIDGVALTETLKKDFPHIKTLVVSMLEDGETIKKLTEIGIDGYISKNSEKGEFLIAITTILEGGTYFSTRIKQVLMNTMLESRKKPVVKLTKREQEVLQLIAKEYTTQEIADELFLSKHTIESYRKNLISKLQVRNLAGLTRYALENGIIE